MSSSSKSKLNSRRSRWKNKDKDNKTKRKKLASSASFKTLTRRSKEKSRKSGVALQSQLLSDHATLRIKIKMLSVNYRHALVRNDVILMLGTHSQSSINLRRWRAINRLAIKRCLLNSCLNQRYSVTWGRCLKISYRWGDPDLKMPLLTLIRVTFCKLCRGINKTKRSTMTYERCSRSSKLR